MQSPLDQFLIKKIIPLEVMGTDVSFTNASLAMVVIALGLMIFQYLALQEKRLVPSRLQSMLEVSYEFIGSMVTDITGKAGLSFVPMIFSLFMFILFANLLGMIPYSYTVTSHIVVTFGIAATLFCGITLYGIAKHGLKFFKLFFPEGVPLWMAPIIVPLEVLSYFMRPITLAVRLFLNMTAGHILLKVFAGFTVMSVWLIPATVPFTAMFIAFEFFVAILQAYIFTILTCIYLNDAINLH